jgi:hypothetical protein
VQWQRWRTCAAAEAEEDDGWREVGRNGGGGGGTVVRRRRRNSFAIRLWRMEMEDGWGCSFFLFLVGLDILFRIYLDKS